MILTNLGCHVKDVMHLDERRQLITVVGYGGKTVTKNLAHIVADGGMYEIRENHRRYLERMNIEPAAELVGEL